VENPRRFLDILDAACDIGRGLLSLSDGKVGFIGF